MKYILHLHIKKKKSIFLKNIYLKWIIYFGYIFWIHFSALNFQQGSARACSTIYLVNVYPKEHRDKSKRVYAILDEHQSSSTSKVMGFHTSWKHAQDSKRQPDEGPMVTSIDQKISLPLLTLLECNQIPDNRSFKPLTQRIIRPPWGRS